MLVSGKSLQPNPMFVDKTGAYSSEVPVRFYIWDKLMALPTNIRLAWKILPLTNTIAYNAKILNYGQKSFIILAPGLVHLFI